MPPRLFRRQKPHAGFAVLSFPPFPMPANRRFRRAGREPLRSSTRQINRNPVCQPVLLYTAGNPSRSTNLADPDRLSPGPYMGPLFNKTGLAHCLRSGKAKDWSLLAFLRKRRKPHDAGSCGGNYEERFDRDPAPIGAVCIGGCRASSRSARGWVRQISRSSIALSNLPWAPGFVIVIFLAFHSVLAYLASLARPLAYPLRRRGPLKSLAGFPIFDRQRRFFRLRPCSAPGRMFQLEVSLDVLSFGSVLCRRAWARKAGSMTFSLDTAFSGS